MNHIHMVKKKNPMSFETFSLSTGHWRGAFRNKYSTDRMVTFLQKGFKCSQTAHTYSESTRGVPYSWSCSQYTSY